ncbi:MAG: hypothetical protein JWN38_592 [Candidatus Saccharibacteria bacterium]|nr:hypothetical protein [Candidatus Saccharibacteria bacterium]
MHEQLTPSPEQQTHELFAELQRPKPTVIALEGGPCGGKTTILEHLQTEARLQERPLVLLPEAATEHIAKLQAAGLTIPELATNQRDGYVAFEKDVLATIITNLEQAKQAFRGTDAIIVTDRSDIGAYVTPEEYAEVLGELGRTRPPYLDLVDKVVYLPSLAREDAAKYTEIACGNPSRFEDAAGAAATCQRTLDTIALHPELSVHWGGEFMTKVRAVTQEILQPEREIEAKYTARPELSYTEVEAVLRWMGARELNATAISQSYHQLAGQEFRLRHGITEANDQFYHFAIKTGSGDSKQELRRSLSRQQFDLLRQAPNFGELHKVRRRYLIDLDGDGRQSIVSADFYADRQLCVLEFEGMTDELAARYQVPGFDRGGVSARNLVQ